MAPSRFINASDTSQVAIGLAVGAAIGYLAYKWVFMEAVKAAICGL